jgi:hypothetical protein
MVPGKLLLSRAHFRRFCPFAGAGQARISVILAGCWQGCMWMLRRSCSMQVRQTQMGELAFGGECAGASGGVPLHQTRLDSMGCNTGFMPVTKGWKPAL